MTALLTENGCHNSEEAKAQECLVGAAILDWFSNLLIAPPDIKLLAEYQTNALSEFLEELGLSLNATKLTGSLTKCLQSNSPEALQGLLSRQYVALFDGFAGPNTVPPYESYYKDAQGRLFQQPYVEMLNILGALDVSVASNCKEPADHLALELAALAEALRQQNSPFIVNLVDRLMSWVPAMGDAVGEKANASFYAELLALLVVYLSSLNSHLQAENIVIH
ncbi:MULTISPECIES: TorD/DmsD family molecular chaperone [unclassified Bartonella]|uniref:TorD/DmsD family molecular chaperone n=1 Tax=unclassified Bartonella TaxID=2645622 RepID=UPI0015FD5B7B|nr:MULTISPECIES: molecular chaperone TorD family protein [unclassified Bartonella]UXN07619.1 molecular chaperone TorD family protein [Bartonella sp. HY761]